MIVKLIEVKVKPGHRDAYLQSQDIWNHETSRNPALLGFFCGQSHANKDTIHLLFFWRSQADYDEWMAAEHDSIARRALAQEHYESLKVDILSPLLEEPSLLPSGFMPVGSTAIHDVHVWSEAYRTSFVLRTAVRIALFDLLEGEGKTSVDLATMLGIEADKVERLCRALSAMRLLEPERLHWHNTRLASVALVRTSPSYQGHLILYNTQPRLVNLWSSLDVDLGLPQESFSQFAGEEMFLRAMSDIANAGQAAYLAAAVDLGARTSLLDVGGALGHYSIELCRANPALTAIVYDRPAARVLAENLISQSGLADRISFVAGDYREGELPGPVDVVLISNVLRGEKPADLQALLERTFRVLKPGGQLIVADAFPESPETPLGLSEGLFYLHMLEGANATLDEMAQYIAQSGFECERVERLARWVALNGIIVARRI